MLFSGLRRKRLFQRIRNAPEIVRGSLKIRARIIQRIRRASHIFTRPLQRLPRQLHIITGALYRACNSLRVFAKLGGEDIYRIGSRL